MARWILCLLAALACAQSAAQVSGSATLVSDYRFRGVSLSNDQPAAQLDLGFDHAAGWYGGLFASSVRVDDQSRSHGEATAYGGYAQRLRDGLSIDAGVDYSGFSGASDYDYAELHAGFATDAMSGRIYLAPNYFGQAARTLYAEINGSHPLTGSVRVVGHAGALQIASGLPGARRLQADASIGIELAAGPLRLQVRRIASDGASPVYPVSTSHSGTWTASVSGVF